MMLKLEQPKYLPNCCFMKYVIVYITKQQLSIGQLFNWPKEVFCRLYFKNKSMWLIICYTCCDFF